MYESGCESETEQLIKFVESKPFLYDKRHDKYKKVYLKKQAWESIASELSFEDGSAAEKRWNSLRGKYSTEMLRLKTVDPNSINAAKWKYFDKLSFLKDHVNPRTNLNQPHIPLNYRQNKSNSWSPMDSVSQSVGNSESTATNQYYNNLLHLLNNTDDDSLDRGDEIVEKKARMNESLQKQNNNHSSIQPPHKRTSSRIFGEYVGEVLQEMDDDDIMEAQLKIMQVLVTYKKKSLVNGSD